MKLSVIGASGAIGRAAVHAALAAGHEVRAVGRSVEKLGSALGPNAHAAELLSADVTTTAGCVRAAAGVDAIVCAVGVGSRTSELPDVPHITRRMLDASKRDAGRAFLLISNVWPYGLPRGSVVSEDHELVPRGPKGRARLEQERMVLHESTGGQLETCVLRLPTFFGPGADHSILAAAAAAVAKRAPAPLIGPIDTPLEFVDVEDVGPVIVRLLERRGFGGQAFNMAGSGLATQRELSHLLMQAAGSEVPLRVLPSWLRGALALVVPVFREMREVDYLLRTSFVLSEAKVVAQLGAAVNHTPFDEAARRWIADLRRRS